MTVEVLLIRHASHDRLGRMLCGRMPGVGLSQEGRAEAERLASDLRRSGPLDAIHASPLERARQTADPIAAAFGLEVEIDPDLDELDFGAWSGRGFDDLASDPLWGRWNADRDRVRPPGGETFAEAQSRAVLSFERILQRHAGGVVALVSHADLIKGMLAWTLGLPLAFYARFEVAPASVSRIALGEWGAKVTGINRTVSA